MNKLEKIIDVCNVCSPIMLVDMVDAICGMTISISDCMNDKDTYIDMVYGTLENDSGRVDELYDALQELNEKEYGMGNAMMTLSLYRHNGMWVFDDDNFGLVAEAFVLGMSEILTETIIDALGSNMYEEGVIVTFSSKPFPTWSAVIEKIREEMGGNWYRYDEKDMEGWLCPALFHYFKDAPNEIYVAISKKTK